MIDLQYVRRVQDYLAEASTFQEDAKILAQLIQNSVRQNGQIWVAGNGGSASMSNHFATDLTLVKTISIRCHALTANSSSITALGNDFEFSKIFSIQLERFGRAEDLLVAISSSGNSNNIIQALELANTIGMKSFSVLGFGGGEARQKSNHSFVLNSRKGDYGPTEDIHSMFLHATREVLEIDFKE